MKSTLFFVAGVVTTVAVLRKPLKKAVLDGVYDKAFELSSSTMRKVRGVPEQRDRLCKSSAYGKASV